MNCIINYVEPDSIAEDIGLSAGDEILSLNGHIIRDILDYRFYVNDESVELSVIKGGVPEIFEIEKDYDDDLGIGFDDVLFDRMKTCGANCMFCFERQLPKGMRPSLMGRDDDYRLSFLYGNYITLANLKQDDIDRIIEQNLSPLYVSVHTTDEILREKIIGRKFPPMMETIKYLCENGIKLHTQAVLCPGVNDGEKLIETIDTLSALYPYVETLAAVPVGLTCHREKLPEIMPYTKEQAQAVLNIIENKQQIMQEKTGTRFVWPSDEFYIKAEKSIPDNDYYEDYSQLQNGVGLVRDFLEDSREGVDILNNMKCSETSLAFVTGQSFYPYLKSVVEKINNKGLKIDVVPVVNNFFGKTVTVAGLMTAKDIVNALSSYPVGDITVIPRICLNDDNLFLDDVSADDLEKSLGRPVIYAPDYFSLTAEKIKSNTCL